MTDLWDSEPGKGGAGFAAEGAEIQEGGQPCGLTEPQRAQRGKAATKLIRTHELMKMERGISRKTGNAGKQDRLRAIPEMN